MRYLKVFLFVLIAILLLFFFFKDVNFTEVARIVKNINPLYPLAFFIGSFLQYFVRAYRWGIILKPYKSGIRLVTLYNFTAIGFFLNLLPGRLGEPVRGILLARAENIKKSVGLASVVVERLLDFLMMILIFLLSLLFIKEDNSALLSKLKELSFYILPILIFVFFLFYLLNSPRIFSLVERAVTALSKIFPQKIRARIVSFTLNFLRGLKVDLPVLDFIRLLLSSILVWLFIAAFYWLLMKGFAIPLDFIEVIPYFSILVVFAAIPTPGMTGTIDLGSKLALMQLYNIPADTAVAFTLLVHVQLLIVWLTAGMIAVWMQGINFKTLKDVKEEGNNEVS